MNIECNAYKCIRCNKLILFNNKRKFRNFEGRSCNECGGEVLPVYVGIDLACIPPGGQ